MRKHIYRQHKSGAREVFDADRYVAISDQLAALEEKKRNAQTRIDWIQRIASELPGTLPSPTISNESERAFFDQPGAWVSFSRSYGETWKGSEILAQLEGAGFVPIAVTLCKWDDYRKHTEPGEQDAIPEKKGRYTLTESAPLAPLWLNPCQHTGTSAYAFYRSPAGLLLKVCVPGPMQCRISAKRIEPLGTWYYERGTARLHFPQEWHDCMRTEAGETVATIAKDSRAWVDTEQGISGNIYFEPYTEQAEFPLTPSAMLRILGE